VILVGWLFLALGAANLVRAVMALRFAAPLADLPLTVSWGYLAALGGFWSVVFSLCALGLFRFRPWGRWGALAAVMLYEAHVWVNHLLFDASDYAARTRLLDLLATFLLLGLVWFTLNRPAGRRVFGQGDRQRMRQGDKVTRRDER